MRFLRFALLALGLLCVTPGCEMLGPRIVPVITTLLTEMIDGKNKLEALDGAAQAWFKEYPNEALQYDWKIAVDRVQASIDIALAAAHGVSELSQDNHVAAAARFVSAWLGLATLARQIGILGSGDVLGSGPHRGLALTEPLACQRANATPP